MINYCFEGIKLNENNACRSTLLTREQYIPK